MSGRDHEFRKFALRQEQFARNEDLSWEFQGELGESQPGRFKVTSYIVATMDLEFNPMCWRKKHSYSTEIHWCYQVNTYWSGRLTRKEDWRLLECRFEQKFVRFLDRIHEVHSIERRPPSEERKARIGHGETKNRQRSKVERHLLYEPDDGEHKGNHQKMRRRLEFSMESAIFRKRRVNVKNTTHRVRLKKLNGKGLCPTRFPKRSMHVSRKRISLRDNFLQSSLPRNHEDKIGGKGKTWITHNNLVH